MNVSESPHPIDRAAACLQANFESLGLPLLHRDQFAAIALSVLRCWTYPTNVMLDAAEELEPEVLAATYPDSSALFQDGGIQKLWQAMLVAANNEAIDRGG